MQMSDGGGAMDAFAQQVSAFKSAADSGSFAVNATGGDALRKAIKNMREWYNHNVFDLHSLAQAPKLGTSNAAKIIAPYMAKVATDDQGLLTRLKEFDKILEDADAAIKKAMANYQNTDHTARDRFTD